MNKLANLVVGVASGAAVLSLSASALATNPPVLGAKAYAPMGTGFGTPHPSEIFNGGDPSGMVTSIRWSHWGAASTTGFGKTAIFKPGGGYYSGLVTAELRASDLGHCPGSKRLAYLKLQAREPAKPGGKLGHWFAWSGSRTVCSFS